MGTVILIKLSVPGYFVVVEIGVIEGVEFEVHVRATSTDTGENSQ